MVLDEVICGCFLTEPIFEQFDVDDQYPSGEPIYPRRAIASTIVST